jgi:Protein kinase domain
MVRAMHGVAGSGRVVGGRYRLRDPIGRGAMGTVWRGRDELLDRNVAVKEVKVPPTLSPAGGSSLYQRTLREAKTAARLNHPGVVTVFDVVEEDGRPWIVMELVQARSLERVLADDGPLPVPDAAGIGRQPGAGSGCRSTRRPRRPVLLVCPAVLVAGSPVLAGPARSVHLRRPGSRRAAKLRRHGHGSRAGRRGEPRPCRCARHPAQRAGGARCVRRPGDRRGRGSRRTCGRARPAPIATSRPGAPGGQPRRHAGQGGRAGQHGQPRRHRGESAPAGLRLVLAARRQRGDGSRVTAH